jgi:hypothetical protein
MKVGVQMQHAASPHAADQGNWAALSGIPRKRDAVLCCAGAPATSALRLMHVRIDCALAQLLVLVRPSICTQGKICRQTGTQA